MRLIIADNLNSEPLNTFDQQTIKDIEHIAQFIKDDKVADLILLFEFVFLNDHLLKLHANVLLKLVETALDFFRFLQKKNMLSSVDLEKHYQTICNIIIHTGIKINLCEIHEALGDKYSCKSDDTSFSACAMYYYLAWKEANEATKTRLAKKLNSVESVAYCKALKKQIERHSSETRYHTKDNVDSLIESLKFVCQRLINCKMSEKATSLCQTFRTSKIMTTLDSKCQTEYLSKLSEINRMSPEDTVQNGNWHQHHMIVEKIQSLPLPDRPEKISEYHKHIILHIQQLLANMFSCCDKAQGKAKYPFTLLGLGSSIEWITKDSDLEVVIIYNDKSYYHDVCNRMQLIWFMLDSLGGDNNIYSSLRLTAA